MHVSDFQVGFVVIDNIVVQVGIRNGDITADNPRYG